jgi:transmembrane sensor
MIDAASGDAQSGRLEREAHAWVRRLISGEATATDGEALKRWCGISPAHAAAFSVASQFWQAFGPAGQSLLDDEKAFIGNRQSAGQRPLIARRAVIGGALAASAAGFMIARPPLGLWPSLSELRADYRTSVGEQRQLAVTDGISVQMNSRTSLSVGVGGDSNVIELIAGEVSFTAPERRSKPFSVIGAGGRASAVNARFDMRLLGSGACVTCLTDQVQVEYRGQVATLGARQQVRYGSDGLAIAVTVDPAVVLAWQLGLMVFQMTPLAEVVEELNRYRTGRIVLLNSDLTRSPVNGRFRIDRPEEALTQIERAFGLHSRTLPGGFVLLT